VAKAKIGKTPAAMISIQITKSTKPANKPDETALGFGQIFTDHWFRCDYQEGKGWHDARVEPYGELRLNPAAAVLHYAQEVFDGLKGFRGVDGKIRLFRPDMHVRRLNRSAERLCMPQLDPELALASIEKLVDIDRDWVPHNIGTAVYIRPTMVATEAFLGVRPAKSYTYFVILSPVGAYYSTGMAPVRLRVEERDVRAVEGGLGGAKAGANYAATLRAGERAKHDGFAQVLYLDGIHRRYLEEVGTMNIMVRIGDRIVTPPLGGTILAGVTRDSVLYLMRSWGMDVEERQISIDEVVEAHHQGALKEVWGTGTAAVISPVGELVYKDSALTIHNNATGELTQRLYDAIVRIQYGQAEAPAGWIVEV
jgi:branched-chain amino acid aminotransferase